MCILSEITRRDLMEDKKKKRRQNYPDGADEFVI